MAKLQLADFAMHYESCGSGDPVLLLPGALGTGKGDFPEQFSWFGQFYTVIAPDPRGYGQSRPPERDYPLNFYRRDAEDFTALMSALGHDRFSVLGWSDGANAAALMAVHHPQRVTRLVMWGGNSFLTEEEVKAFQSMRSITSWSSRAAEAMRKVYGESLEEIWHGYVAGLENLYEHGGEIYRAELHLVQCPTLILHGAQDPLVPSEHPRIILEGISGAALYTFPEGRHNIHSKYPAEFNGIVFDFLRGKSAASAGIGSTDSSVDGNRFEDLNQ
jgi:valacyclovir hydrolase